jgi:hypothetical protein
MPAINWPNRPMANIYFFWMPMRRLNRLINSAVHRMHLHQLGLLSLFANQQMDTPGERAVVPSDAFYIVKLIAFTLNIPG